MGAPKGNKNGAATRFQPLTNEETVSVSTRLPKSDVQKMNAAIAASGKTKSEWLREAIVEKLGSN